jgi:hypothetical protein
MRAYGSCYCACATSWMLLLVTTAAAARKWPFALANSLRLRKESRSTCQTGVCHLALDTKRVIFCFLFPWWQRHEMAQAVDTSHSGPSPCECLQWCDWSREYCIEWYDVIHESTDNHELCKWDFCGRGRDGQATVRNCCLSLVLTQHASVLCWCQRFCISCISSSWMGSLWQW